jgi:hypothetical protein
MWPPATAAPPAPRQRCAARDDGGCSGLAGQQRYWQWSWSWSQSALTGSSGRRRSPHRDDHPSTIPPDASIADPGEVQRPAGSPPGEVGEQMVQDVASAVAECQGGPSDGLTVLVAWGKDHDRTWLIVARPPRRGENWLCWANGLFDAGGAGGVGSKGRTPLTPLQASGSQNLRSGTQYWGQIVGTVTKRAARIRVLFNRGIPPLDLTPIPGPRRSVSLSRS